VVLEKIARWVLGAVFVAAAASKGVDVEPFVLTVQRICHLDSAIARWVALLLVSAEALLGFLLLAAGRRREYLAAAATLLLCFAATLAAGLYRGEAIVCNCFGPLGPKLPVPWQILLDIALASLGMAGLWAHPAGRTLRFRRRMLLHGLLIVGVALTCGAVAASTSVGDAKAGAGKFSVLASMDGTPGAPSRVPSLFFLVNFADFGCVLCLDDFLALADSVNRLSQEGKVEVHLISRIRGDRGPERERTMLRGWMEGNHFGFDARVDEDSLIDRLGCTRSTVVAFDTEKRLVVSGAFPLGRVLREELLQELRREAATLELTIPRNRLH